jgi:hypothetical protein
MAGLDPAIQDGSSGFVALDHRVTPLCGGPVMRGF